MREGGRENETEATGTTQPLWSRQEEKKEKERKGGTEPRGRNGGISPWDLASGGEAHVEDGFWGTIGIER